MAGKLQITLRHGYDPLYSKNGFDNLREKGDEFVCMARTGVLRNWQLTYSIHADTLSKAQYGWMLTHFAFVKEAIFETEHVGLSTPLWGKWRMKMKG